MFIKFQPLSVFLFNILCDKMWRIHKEILQHTEDDGSSTTFFMKGNFYYKEWLTDKLLFFRHDVTGILKSEQSEPLLQENNWQYLLLVIKFKLSNKIQDLEACRTDLHNWANQDFPPRQLVRIVSSSCVSKNLQSVTDSRF